MREQKEHIQNTQVLTINLMVCILRYIKFGLGRCVEDASHEIRDGHISREEGVALAKKYEGEFPEKNYLHF